MVQKHIRSHRFYVTPKFRAVLDLLDGNDPRGRKAWCMDLEFATRKKVVHEVSRVNHHTGVVALDALVKQSEYETLGRRRPHPLDGEDSVDNYGQRLIERFHR